MSHRAVGTRCLQICDNGYQCERQTYDNDGGVDRGAVWILAIPEPGPTLQFVAAFGVLMLLKRVRGGQRYGTRSPT